MASIVLRSSSAHSRWRRSCRNLTPGIFDGVKNAEIFLQAFLMASIMPGSYAGHPRRRRSCRDLPSGILDGVDHAGIFRRASSTASRTLRSPLRNIMTDASRPTGLADVGRDDELVTPHSDRPGRRPLPRRDRPRGRRAPAESPRPTSRSASLHRTKKTCAGTWRTTSSGRRSPRRRSPPASSTGWRSSAPVFSSRSSRPTTRPASSGTRWARRSPRRALRS